MAKVAADYQSSDFPLPAGSSQNPIRADYPRQVIIYNGNDDWVPSTDIRLLAGVDYVAVSYRQSDFRDKIELEEMVRRICLKRDIEAYWIDFACTGETPEKKNVDLYRIADVFRNAKATLIMIKGEDGQPLSEGWLSWGMRIWTFPEALLSKSFIVQVGLSNLLIKKMTLNQVANYAYGSEEQLRKLIDLYSQLGKDFSNAAERIEMLCDAIWSRHSGPDTQAAVTLDALTAYPAEKVYALMGFFLNRILPKSTESEDEAFERLVSVNGWDFDSHPGTAYKPGGTRRLGMRDKKEKSMNEIDDSDLPKYVEEAKFDYGETLRTTCEKGTREEILDEVYKWFGLISNGAPSHTLNKTILWLNGLAGSGKSTIAQTAALRCDDDDVLGGTFFCSRKSEKCRDIKNIFPTIAFLLGRFNTNFKRKLSEIYRKDKDIQRALPERQLRKLIIDPLRSVSHIQHYVVIIDALDECTDNNARSVILEALDRNRDELGPLKFLITSRPDENIRGAFLTLCLSEDTQNLDLNMVNPEHTRRDIRTLLARRLSSLAKSRGLKAWPSSEELDALVNLSNGLFIFASTTVKYLSNKSASSLKDQLEKVLSSNQPVSDSPYKHLDILYLQVFTDALGEISAKLKDRLQLVLGSLVLGEELFSIITLGDLLDMSTEDIRETLRNLHSLIVVPDNDDEKIRLIHPSIDDFLTDDNRCADSRFAVKKAAGHSVITRCCFRILGRIAESEQMRLFLQAPTRQKLTTLNEFIDENEHSAIHYSYSYWPTHMENSDLNENMMEDFDQLVSTRKKFLLVEDADAAGTALLGLIVNSPKQFFPTSKYPLLLFQCVLFLYGEIWKAYQYNSSKNELLNALKTLHTNYGYVNGLFGLAYNDDDIFKLELAIVSLKEFVPEEDVPQLFDTIENLKRAAEETHSVISQQTIPENEKLSSEVLSVINTFYQRLRDEASIMQEWYNYSDDYAKQLETCLLTCIQLMSLFNEILSHILMSDFDRFLTERFSKAFSEADDAQIGFLQSILLAGLMKLQFQDIGKLQPLFDIPTDSSYTSFALISAFAGALVDTGSTEQIKSTYPILFSTFFDEANCCNSRFFIDLAARHPSIAVRNLERLVEFTTTQEMQLYFADPSREKLQMLKDNVENEVDTPFAYAYKNWIYYIGESDGQMDKPALQQLRELVSNHLALDILIENSDAAIRAFLGLFEMFSRQPSPPSDIMKELYEAALYLCKNHWPHYLVGIKEHTVPIKNAVETLKTRFLYKNGLYSLDPDFPLLSIAMMAFIRFLPKIDKPELENDIHELRKHSNRVHELIMQHAIPEDESECLALRACLSTLHKKLRSSYKAYRKGKWDLIGEDVHHSALPIWHQYFDEFWIEIRKIFRISDTNFNQPIASEASNPTVAGSSGQPGLSKSAAKVELREDNNEGAENEAGQHKSIATHTTLIDSLEKNQDDVPASEVNDEAVKSTSPPPAVVERPASPLTMAPPTQNADRQHIMLLSAIIGVILGMLVWYFYNYN